MAKQDASPAARYTFELQALLEDTLGLTLPGGVLEVAARRAFEAGVSPEEAAIRIGHEHARRLCESWVEEGVMAPDMTEFILANRLEESAKLALQTGLRLRDLLPDLREFVSLPCFSEGFHVMVANIGTWTGLPDQFQSVPDGHSNSEHALTA